MNLNTRQEKVVNASERKILCLSSAGSGKAILNSDFVPTPEGMRKVSDIKVGDYLFDRKGNPTKVLGVFPQGKKEVYELEFGDGRKAKCSKDHIWYVHRTSWKNKNDFREFTVDQLLKEQLIDSSRAAKFYIPCSEAVKYTEKQYKIHPYIIGAFLGDGCCREAKLTLSSETDEIPNNICKFLGNGVTPYKLPANNYSWVFFKDNEKLPTSILPPELLHYSYEKRIPKEYKIGSIEQRLSLLQGLFDTDGSITKQKKGKLYTTDVTFTSTSSQLIADVKEVLGSLGYVSTIRVDNRPEKYTTGVCYELGVNIPNSEKDKLFLLKRKRDIALSNKDQKQHRNYDRTSIRSITNLGYEEEMTCFYVDNSEHLFLMSEFCVTHNTRVLTERVRVLIEKKGVKPQDIVAISFTNLAANEMRERLGDIAKDTYIGTIHSYANKICLMNGIDTQSYIETEKFEKIIEKAITIPYNNYPKVDHVLIDECQDLSPLEYQFLSKIPTNNIFYIGDNRQMIYTFRGSSEEFIDNLYKDNDYKKYFLVENYRNAPNIVKFADSFLTSMVQLSPQTIPIKKKDGVIQECPFNEALDELELSGNYGSWFILARTNKEIEKIQELLDERDIPNITFKKGDVDNFQLESLLKENIVKVLSIHSAKGSEAANVIVVGAKTYNEDERRIAYVAATRAKNVLYWCPTVIKKTRPGFKDPQKDKAQRRFGTSFNKVVMF